MARKMVLDIWCEMCRQRWMDCCCLLVRGMGKGRGMRVSHRRTCKGEMVCVLVSTRAFLGGVLWRKRGLRVF